MPVLNTGNIRFYSWPGEALAVSFGDIDLITTDVSRITRFLNEAEARALRDLLNQAFPTA